MGGGRICCDGDSLHCRLVVTCINLTDQIRPCPQGCFPHRREMQEISRDSGAQNSLLPCDGDTNTRMNDGAKSRIEVNWFLSRWIYGSSVSDGNWIANPRGRTHPMYQLHPRGIGNLGDHGWIKIPGPNRLRVGKKNGRFETWCPAIATPHRPRFAERELKTNLKLWTTRFLDHYLTCRSISDIW